MILIDEASRVPDDLYMSLRPMLAVGDGDLWLMSTPCGQRGFFYEAWRSGGEEWMRVSVKATDCSRITAKFLNEERGEMGDAMFSQEYMCEFVGRGAGMFAREIVEAAFDESVAELEIR